jgi:hypothetical protein
VLSQAGDDYFGLVDSLTRASGGAGRKDAPPREESVSDVPPPRSFSVQVAQTGMPRMRAIRVRAADADSARERALEETGPGWSVVAITSKS